MLLLMPRYSVLDTLFDDDKSKEITLKDLFEIQVGLMEDKYKFHDEPITQNGNTFFLRISSLVPDWKSIKSITDLKKNEERLQQKRGKIGRSEKSNIKIPVPENRILTREDYLITSRGVLRGLSMFNAEKIFVESVKVVPSHHFISLRPRKTLIDFSIPYLHLILDTMVHSLASVQEKKKKDEWTERKLKYEKELANLKSANTLFEKDEKRIKMISEKLANMDEFADRNIFPVLNILSIKDIENIEVNILLTKQDQEEVVKKYQNLQDDLRKAIEENDSFMTDFGLKSGIINPNSNI